MGLSTMDSRKMMQTASYVISGGIEARPLVSYMIAKKETGLAKLNHALFYFGDGMGWHLDQLHKLGAIDIEYSGSKSTITSKNRTFEIGGSKMTMLQILDRIIGDEILGRYPKENGEVLKAKDVLECIDSNFYTLVKLRRHGNEMPYSNFLELNTRMKYPERLRLKHYGVLDFRYEGEWPIAVLEKKAANVIDALTK